MANAKDVIRKTLRYRWPVDDEAIPGDDLAATVARKFAATYKLEDGSTDETALANGWRLTRRIFAQEDPAAVLRMPELSMWRDRVREYLRG